MVVLLVVWNTWQQSVLVLNINLRLPTFTQNKNYLIKQAQTQP